MPAHVPFIHDGDAIDYTPTEDTPAGTIVAQGDLANGTGLVGITKHDIPAGTLGALAVVGVFDIPKATGVGEAIDVGSNVTWNIDTQLAGTDNGPNILGLGKSIEPAGDDDPTVRVRLSQ